MSDSNHILVQDDDGHWYVIPEDKQRLFGLWVATNGEEDQPEWADEVGGAPSRVVFGNYTIK